jgi:hypothetical protein
MSNVTSPSVAFLEPVEGRGFENHLIPFARGQRGHMKKNVSILFFFKEQR